jgi:hypothetical protein
LGWRLLRVDDPLIPLAVLRNPVVRAGTLAACFGMGTFTGLTIYVPLYFEAAWGLTAVSSGLLFDMVNRLDWTSILLSVDAGSPIPNRATVCSASSITKCSPS